MQTSHSVGPYGQTPGDVNVKGPSPTLEELTVHCHSEIHTLATNYRATMLGAPQRGQLLSPSRRRLLGGALPAERQFTPRQKRGEGNAHLFFSPRNFHSFTKAPENPGGKRTAGRDLVPAARRPAPCLPRARAEHRHYPELLPRGGWQQGSCGLPGPEKTHS